MTNSINEMYSEQDYEPVYNPYYQLDTGEVYDKDRKDFIDKESEEYKAFLATGNKPLSIGQNGYTLEQLKRSVIKFYGWEMGECLMTVDELRDKLMGELEAKSASFEENLNKGMHFTSSLGFKVNGDRRTRSNIEDLISMLPDDTTTIAYRDYDNQARELNRVQLKTMLQEHLENGLDLYTQKWSKQSALTSAQTKDELKQVDLTFAYKDFSE